MWKWIMALWDAIMVFLGRYKEIKQQEEKEREEHLEEVKVETKNEIEEKHNEVVNSDDPNATVDKQLYELGIVSEDPPAGTND
jgi:hypothetical protein